MILEKMPPRIEVYPLQFFDENYVGALEVHLRKLEKQTVENRLNILRQSLTEDKSNIPIF